jgi:hypothetical protein
LVVIGGITLANFVRSLVVSHCENYFSGYARMQLVDADAMYQPAKQLLAYHVQDAHIKSRIRLADGAVMTNNVVCFRCNDFSKKKMWLQYVDEGHIIMLCPTLEDQRYFCGHLPTAHPTQFSVVKAK